MKLVVVGGSGYLGSEIMEAAEDDGLEAFGTYHQHPQESLVEFTLSDESTWDNIQAIGPDYLVWAAQNYKSDLVAFRKFTKSLGAKILYVSSDVVNCRVALNADGDRGYYARAKNAEQSEMDENRRANSFIIGPIYGANSAGVLDKRSQTLIEAAGEPQEYWDNVVRTFVAVKGLARTIIAEKDRTYSASPFRVGSFSKESYYQHFVRRAEELGLDTECIRPVALDADEAQDKGICLDTSYAGSSSRLWANG